MPKPGGRKRRNMRKSVLFSVTLLGMLLVVTSAQTSGGDATEGLYTLTALYPKTEGSTFDMDYYETSHGPLVQELFQPVSIQVNEGVSGAEEGSEPAYWVITVITFETLEDLQNAVATHGEEVVGDIQNFTDVEVQLQINSTTE